MELSNVKLIAPARRTAPLSRISIVDPLEGRVYQSDFDARGMSAKRISRFMNTFSFVNQNEGYIAQRIGRNEYEIQGHWSYGKEVVLGAQELSDRKMYSVRIERPELSEVARPELRVVGTADEYAAA